MPSSRTRSTSGSRPVRPDVGVDVQSPSELVSSRRPGTSRRRARTARRRSPRPRSASAARRVEVVLEVDRLPGVQHHRAGERGWPAAARRCRWNRAARSSSPSPHEPYCHGVWYGLALLQHHFARRAASRPPRAAACPPASARRRAPGCRSTRGGSPTRGPCRNPNPRSPATSSRVCSRPGLPPREARTHSPTWNGAALRHPLERPATGQVEHLVGVRRHGQRQFEAAAPGTASPRPLPEPGPLPHEAAAGEHLHLDVEREAVLRVDARARAARSRRPSSTSSWPSVRNYRRPPAAVAVADEARTAEPALAELREHRHGLGIGDRAVADGGLRSECERGQLRGIRRRRAVRPQCRMRGSRPPPRSTTRLVPPAVRCTGDVSVVGVVSGMAASLTVYFTAPSARPADEVRWNRRNTTVGARPRSPCRPR